MASVRRMETKRLLPKVGILGVKPSGSDADPGPEMGKQNSLGVRIPVAWLSRLALVLVVR